MTIREKIIAEALSWEGTPFHHEARVKGAGVDCAQFLIGVYGAVGVQTSVPLEHYPHDWHFHRAEERYLTELSKYAIQVDAPQPGDIAMFKFGHCASHGAIVIDWPLCIHAYVKQGVVRVDGLTSAELKDRLHSFWSPNGIKELEA